MRAPRVTWNFPCGDKSVWWNARTFVLGSSGIRRTSGQLQLQSQCRIVPGRVALCLLEPYWVAFPPSLVYCDGSNKTPFEPYDQLSASTTPVLEASSRQERQSAPSRIRDSYRRATERASLLSFRKAVARGLRGSDDARRRNAVATSPPLTPTGSPIYACNTPPTFLCESHSSMRFIG